MPLVSLDSHGIFGTSALIVSTNRISNYAHYGSLAFLSGAREGVVETEWTDESLAICTAALCPTMLDTAMHPNPGQQYYWTALLETRNLIDLYTPGARSTPDLHAATCAPNTDGKYGGAPPTLR